MENKTKIAIVDDDPGIRETLEVLLHENGFEVEAVSSIKEFNDLVSRPNINLVLIDLQLKGESGLSLAIQVRNELNIPVIMLTGVGDEIDKIVGLETGADDYLMKPFNPRELVARIRAVLRRYGLSSAPQQSISEPSENEITFGSFTLDTTKRELTCENEGEISLTNSEYKILEYFTQNPERIIPRTELLENLGSDLSRYIDRTMDVMILRLRRKIENTPSKPVHLQTRRGQGYIFIGVNSNRDN